MEKASHNPTFSTTYKLYCFCSVQFDYDETNLISSHHTLFRKLFWSSNLNFVALRNKNKCRFPFNCVSKSPSSTKMCDASDGIPYFLVLNQYSKQRNFDKFLHLKITDRVETFQSILAQAFHRYKQTRAHTSLFVKRLRFRL